jgi:hypothetical protein
MKKRKTIKITNVPPAATKDARFAEPTTMPSNDAMMLASTTLRIAKGKEPKPKGEYARVSIEVRIAEVIDGYLRNRNERSELVGIQKGAAETRESMETRVIEGFLGTASLVAAMQPYAKPMTVSLSILELEVIAKHLSRARQQNMPQQQEWRVVSGPKGSMLANYDQKSG